MRKNQQMQILTLLQTIKQAQAADMLAECQAGAQAIGEFIESIYGEGTKTVTLLEDYCEELYLASIGKRGQNTLRKSLTKIENEIRRELRPDRLEIAFLSYNASMSDSIASIYLAAKEDPACDAYWIPIPYYDRNKDGSFGEMHYEGQAHYGPEFKCVDWQQYDIKARRPDVIVTFAPYDGENYVTSIHPDFYCERLCGLTDMLVYVPYFTVDDSIRGQKHLCLSPGCRYAHKVIVQSEKMRGVFIDTFKEQFGSRYGKPEEKFAALGSPKFDAVINAKRDGCTVPPEWEKLISKGGSRKKVVLYNTSINTFLSDSDKYMQKLRSVLETFEARDDAVLWWRPHPLMEATLSSMRPRLLEEYRALVAEYKEKNYGIYDDSSDLHRAVAMSDAYYGDYSSLVSLYAATGKPMSMQNINRLDADSLYLRVQDMLKDGDDFWFTAANINGLFKMNKDERIPEFMGHLPGHGIYDCTLSYGLARVGDNLYLSAFQAKDITVYSIPEGTFRTIPLRRDITENLNPPFLERWKLISAIAYGKYVFFIPGSYPAIVRLDTETEELTYITDWVEKAEPYIEDSERLYWSDACTMGQKIYAAGQRANMVLEFDMESCTSKIHETGEKDDCWSSLESDGKYLWLVPKHDKPVLRFDPVSGETEAYDNFPEGYKHGRFAMRTICISGDKKWMLPNNADTAVCLDANGVFTVDEIFKSEFKKVPPTPELRKKGVYGTVCWFAKEYDDVIYAPMYQTFSLITYSTKDGTRKETRLTCSGKSRADFGRKRYLKDFGKFTRLNSCVFKEDKAQSLHGYLNFITEDAETDDGQALKKRQLELFSDIAANPDGTAGREIYNYAKAQILKQEAAK